MLTEQEQIWMDALRAIHPKLKMLGWKAGNLSNSKIIHDNMLQMELIDKTGRTHWLRVNKDGALSFAPVGIMGIS